MRTTAFLVGTLAMLAVAAEPVAGGFELLGVNREGYLVFRRPQDSARMVWIPAGSFRQNGYIATDTDEPPAEELTVGGFAIDETEVTAAQLCSYLNAGGVGVDGQLEGELLVTPVVDGVRFVAAAAGREGAWQPQPGGAMLPALGVTGHGALAFARWAGGDLPTLPEWQKAAAGPAGRTFPWGDAQADATRANFRRDGPQRPMPVGSYPAGASPYGLLDMAGNVYERVWTERGGQRRPVMIRGGSWASPHALNLRTWDLCMQPMEVAERTVGFRTVVRHGAGLPADAEEAAQLAELLSAQRLLAVREPAPAPAAAHAPATAPARLRLAASWDAAVAEARARNVPLLVSLHYDTCGQCDRVKVGLLRDPQFVEFVNEHAVFLVGQWPGDAEDAPHPAGADGTCPLWPGLTCRQHVEIFAQILERVRAFQVSPGTFVLDATVPDSAPLEKRILTPESQLPKWGGGAEVYIARLREAQEKLGTGTPYSAWQTSR